MKRKTGADYATAFYAHAGCSVMFLNAAQVNALGDAPPNVGFPNVVRVVSGRRA